MLKGVLAQALRQPPPRLVCWLVLLAAAVLRVVLLLVVGLEPMRVESQKVAVALAETGQFAAAFSIDSGPTAHVGPFTPLLTAAAYTIFGVESPIAELTLSLVAIALTFASYVLASQCLGLLGVPWAPRAIGLLFLLFVPFQFRLELIEGRYWDMLPATCALLLMLRHVLRREGGGPLAARELAGLGAVSGAVFFLSPPAGLASMALIAILTMRKGRLPLWPVPALTSLVVIAMLALPWAARNQTALGHPVWLRSNFGLEFALANHDLAASADPRTAFLARYAQIHPYENPPVLREMRTLGGEVAYNARLLAETKAWVAANPGAFALISARHLGEFLVPPPWIRSPWVAQSPVWYLFTLVSLLGVAAVLGRLWRDRLYLYVAAALLVPALPYMLVQPVYRYRYLISSLVVLFAVHLATRARSHARPRAVQDKRAMMGHSRSLGGQDITRLFRGPGESLRTAGSQD